MANSTFFVALPYSRSDNGALVPGEVSWCTDSIQAAKEAERLANNAAGAMAFSRGVDLESGIFEPMAVIKCVGAVPQPDAAFMLG